MCIDDARHRCALSAVLCCAVRRRYAVADAGCAAIAGAAAAAAAATVPLDGTSFVALLPTPQLAAPVDTVEFIWLVDASAPEAVGSAEPRRGWNMEG